jgi:hypothetical protein
MMDYVISNLVSAKTFRLHYNVDLNPALRAESLRNQTYCLDGEDFFQG